VIQNAGERDWLLARLAATPDITLRTVEGSWPAAASR